MLVGHRQAFWVILLMLGVVGCAETQRPGQELHVFAASSLREAFDSMSMRFSEVEPGVRVRLNFAGSQALRLQIRAGAKADVFASANMGHVEALIRVGRLEGGRAFARGQLVLVTPEGNPGDIQALSDLAEARRVVLGTLASPIGAYTERSLLTANDLYGDGFSERVAARVVSRESNARLVRAKIELGEADAAIIYRSDTRGRTRLRVIELPREVMAEAVYVQGRVLGAESPTIAERWLRFVESDTGQDILREHGFEEVM